MIIRQTRRFVKQLAKQPAKVQQAFFLRLELLEEDVNNPLLRIHPLQAKLKGHYSMNITGDVRALYMVIDDELYLFDVIGSHSQLYG